MNKREVITENLKKLLIGKSVNLLRFVSMFIITELNAHNQSENYFPKMAHSC